jgi:hypothetical protein
VRALRLLLFSFLVALPALAGTGYVPFVAALPAGSDGTRATQVSFNLINLGVVPRVGGVHFVAAGQDGNSGGVDLLSLRILPGQTFSRTCCDNASGLLILSGAPQIEYEIYLQETFPQEAAPNSLSVRLQVITAEDALPAGSRGTLQTLFGDGVGVNVTGFGILNLGHQTAHCSVENLPPFVEQFVRQVVVPPVSVMGFPDLFLRPIFGTEGRPIVTCDQPFYPFALLYHGLLGSRFSLGLPWIEFAGPVRPLGTVP